MKQISFFPLTACIILLQLFSSCSKDDEGKTTSGTEDHPEEWYTGGKLGTIDADLYGDGAYAQETPAVDEQGLYQEFQSGEKFFEKYFVEGTPGSGGQRIGLGPAYVRSACIICHPNYGHGKRMTRYNADDYGNGYLLVVFDKTTQNLVPELTGMPQTRAVSPYQPPIDEKGISIQWLPYTDEHNNTFPDGETYSLIYPEVSIDPAYIHTDPKPSNYDVRLEATIGIYGTGLIDAIPDDSLLAQYEAEKAKGFTLNDTKYDPANFIKEPDGTSHPGRYTYGLTRGTLQDGPGANAIWNIFNENRSDRPYLYTSKAWAKAMSESPAVLLASGKTSEEIYADLAPEDTGDTTKYKHSAEMSDQDYIDFMVWHRGLAVPSARDLDDPEVTEGKKLFYSMGCINCHRPSWTTGEDNYSGDPMVKGKLPQYPHQKIWPYTDLLQHRLDMKNGIRTGWCRTTPLWGRGLSERCTGAGDHLHDMRARNYIEAIMWHGGDAKWAREKFYNLKKEQRDAVVKFLQSI